MTWNEKQTKRADESSELEALDPALKQALGDFKASVHAWSESEFNRARTAHVTVIRRTWRMAAGWAMASVLLLGSASGGVYEFHKHQVEAQATAAREAAHQQVELAAQRARDEAQREEDVCWPVSTKPFRAKCPAPWNLWRHCLIPTKRSEIWHHTTEYSSDTNQGARHEEFDCSACRFGAGRSFNGECSICSRAPAAPWAVRAWTDVVRPLNAPLAAMATKAAGGTIPASSNVSNLPDDQRKGFDRILLQHRETLIDLRGNLEKAELSLEPPRAVLISPMKAPSSLKSTRSPRRVPSSKKPTRATFSLCAASSLLISGNRCRSSARIVAACAICAIAVAPVNGVAADPKVPAATAQPPHPAPPGPQGMLDDDDAPPPPDPAAPGAGTVQ